jgi:hypothetical protein
VADKTINDLTATTSLAGGDLFEIENTGNNSRKITAANVKVFMVPSGTSFPGSPATSDRYFRTDRNIEYVYDGTRWLSMQQFVLSIADNERNQSHTTTGAWAKAVNPFNGDHDIYVEKAKFAYFLTGTGNWTVTITANGNGSNISSGAFSTAGAWTVISVSVNAVYTSALKEWETSVTENSGTASLNGAVAITFRLVG